MTTTDSTLLGENDFLSKINMLNLKSLLAWQIQDIFIHAFKHKYFYTINYLLTQEDFCNKLYLNNQNLLTIAYAIVNTPECIELVTNILNNPYILYTQEQEETVTKLNYYIFLENSKSKYDNPITPNQSAYNSLRNKISI